MNGPKVIGKYAYGRGRSMLDTGALIKLIDYEGNYNVFKLGRKEPMGDMTSQFTNAVDGVAAAAASEFAEFRFVEPGQEGRLFHFRPYLFAVMRTGMAYPGRVLFPAIPDNIMVPIMVPPPSVSIPMGAAIQLKHPAGDWRWGTDVKRDVVVTTPGGVVITTAGVGGVDGGFLEAPLVPFIDDPSDLWDIFTIFGHTIEMRLVNRSNFFWPPGFPMGGANDNKDYFISLIGAKYVLLDVEDEIVRKVEERRIEYQPVVIGGIPTVTTKA